MKIHFPYNIQAVRRVLVKRVILVFPECHVQAPMAALDRSMAANGTGGFFRVNRQTAYKIAFFGCRSTIFRDCVPRHGDSA
jgi:hypothetical protein